MDVKIMQVEDEAVFAMVTDMELRNLGYPRTSHASSGEEALRKFKRERPDIVLMDIRLSGKMDGIEAAEVIRSETDIPIIFITAFDDVEFRQRADRVKPLAYMVKPLEILYLKQLIDGYFAG